MGTDLARPAAGGAAVPGRIDWVDYAKGICIVLVVMMHSTLGVQEAAGQTGFMDYVVAFARPFRMPDFFLISGLFLARVIDRDWRTYLDRKVVHFAYFYLLGTAIQFGLKAPGLLQAVLGRDANGNLIRKSGVMAIVIAGGDVQVGDAIDVTLPEGERRPLMPV